MSPTWRSPDLEAKLGGPLDSTGLIEGTLNTLVANGEREGEQLDFKAVCYPATTGRRTGWTQEQEFAKDVGAFANHRGGLILIGVVEQSNVAVGLQPATSSTPAAEEQRLRRALMNYLAPIVDPIFVPISQVGGTGWYLAVVVPPSARSPHAVLGHSSDQRHSFRYPMRHGADTIWLTESEIADRYQRRFAAASERRSRVERVVDEGCRTLSRAEGLWLYVACVPQVPAAGTLDSGELSRVEDWYRQAHFISPIGRYLPALGRGIAGPGRVTFTKSLSTSDQDETEVFEAYVELLLEGASFAGLPTAARTADDATSRSVGELTVVDDALMLVDICLRWTERQVGAWGTATAVIGLFDADTVDGRPIRPLDLVSLDYGEPRRMSGTRLLIDSPRAETTVDLAAVDTIQRRFVVAHHLLAGLLQWFGLAEPLQITRTGALVSRQWPRAWSQVEQWAQQWDVECEAIPRR